MSKNGEATDWHQLLSAAVLGDIDVKQKLWELAFTVHEQGQSGADSANATADISEADLLERLRHLHPHGSWDWAADMVEIMKRRAGLLIESRLSGTSGGLSPEYTAQLYGSRVGLGPNRSLLARGAAVGRGAAGA